MNPDSNLQMGSNQAGLTGTGAPFGVQQTGPTGPSAPVTGQPSKDTLEKAGALVAALYLPPMSTPMLLPPDPNLAIAISQMTMDKICLNILDSWSKNLQQIAEAKKEAERRDEVNPLLREIHVTAALFLAIGSIFLRAIFGTNVAEALQKSDGLTDEKAIAKKFAAQLYEWANSGILNGYLLTIVDQLPSAQKLSEAEKIVLAKQMEVMLLNSSLVALYKTYQFGSIGTLSITPKELINLLKNTNVLDDKQATFLAARIMDILDDLPEVDRERLLGTLTSYMNSNPNLPTLFDLGQTTDVQMSILNNSST